MDRPQAVCPPVADDTRERPFWLSRSPSVLLGSLSAGLRPTLMSTFGQAEPSWLLFGIYLPELSEAPLSRRGVIYGRNGAGQALGKRGCGPPSVTLCSCSVSLGAGWSPLGGKCNGSLHLFNRYLSAGVPWLRELRGHRWGRVRSRQEHRNNVKKPEPGVGPGDLAI